uniref:translation initiation factor IF-2-like n=1 Tax=Nyctereutes procyonoides TaxID=34880 RepID=UPI0024447EA8|nr:translation initiation factor IF-2-like [Nyctereutes procyonoides]
MAHQSARASSTGGQGGQFHLVTALQPRQLSSGQRQSGNVLAGEGGSAGCQPLGDAAPAAPRSRRRRPRTRREAWQLPARLGVGRTAASAGGEARRRCRSPASRGGSFVPSSFWPQRAPLRRPAARTRAAGALRGAPPRRREEARGARLARGGGAGVPLRARAVGRGEGSRGAEGWARSGPRVARKQPHATQRLAPAACRRSGGSGGGGGGGGGSSGGSKSSEQRGRDIGVLLYSTQPEVLETEHSWTLSQLRTDLMGTEL